MNKSLFVLSGLLVLSGCGKKEGGKESAAAPSAAEEGVILAVAGEPMPEGLVKEDEFSMEIKDAKLKVTLPDREIDGDMSMKEVKKRKTESIGGGKYRMTIIEERKTERSKMMGQEQPAKETVNPLEGKPLIAEKGEDGVWKVKLESGEADADMEKEIAKVVANLSKDEDAEVYGTVPRKVGDEWTVSSADMMEIENAEGAIKLRLSGIEDHKGERCAKITGTLDLTGKPPGDEAPGMKMRITGDMVIFRSIEHRTDLSNELKGTMEVSGEMEPQPGMKMKMSMQGAMTVTGAGKVSKAE